jgi:hypothetical protein
MSKEDVGAILLLSCSYINLTAPVKASAWTTLEEDYIAFFVTGHKQYQMYQPTFNA